MADSLKSSEQGRDILGSALKTVEDGDRDASRMVRRHFRLESRRTSICLHPEEWSMFDLVSKRLAGTTAAKGSSVMTASTPQPMRLSARSGSFTV